MSKINEYEIIDDKIVLSDMKIKTYEKKNRKNIVYNCIDSLVFLVHYVVLGKYRKGKSSNGNALLF